ncbi:MAG: hypothetical protein M3416_01600 [Acidobacteriota bacterium]|nr:hypothetical protein [Acidobacteriota bacterium]
MVSLVAFIATVYNRKRPNRLVINELRKARLIDVRDEVGDKVQITYSGKPVEILWQVNLEIFNEGVDAIKGAEISCSLPEGVNILEISLISSTGALPAETNISENKATIKLPYVNPYREHQHVIKLSINTDHEVGAIRFEGAGGGWSVRHAPLLTEKQESKVVLISVMALFGSAGISFILATLWGVTFREINLKTILVMLPVFIVAVVSVRKVVKGRYRKERFHLDNNSQGPV